MSANVVSEVGNKKHHDELMKAIMSGCSKKIGAACEKLGIKFKDNTAKETESIG